MQHQRWTHKIACLSLAALMALTAGAGLASSDGVTTENAWGHGEALHGGKLALAPMELADPISLSPDGARALALQEGTPVVVSLADGAISPFWKAAEGLPAEIAEIVQLPLKEIDPTRVSWSFDGRYLAFAGIGQEVEASGHSALLWVADLAAGTIAPLKDARISTPEDPAYFTNVHSVAFHPNVPVLYFVASEQTILSRMNPFSAPSEHTMVFHYSYESDSVSMMETTTGLLPWYLSPIQCDGGTLAMVTANAKEAALLALAPMHAISRLTLDDGSNEMWGSGLTRLADLCGDTALLIVLSPMESGHTLVTISLPGLLPLDEPEDPELPVVPKKGDFGEPHALDLKGVAPQAAAFSPAGECVAALGALDGKLALAIVELDSGKVGSVDLSALNLPESAQALGLQWEGNDRLLIQTADGAVLCAFSGE